MKVKVEFLGGLHIVAENKREHVVEIGEGSTMREAVELIADKLIPHEKDKLVFMDQGTVRPGILVLINDTDWELEGKEAYVVEPGDVLTFTSTLHGG